MLSVQQTLFQEKFKALKISNGTIDLVCPLDFGPRILFFGFSGGPNEFYLNQQDLESFKDDDIFRLYGGHRVWTAPEDLKTTYIPDNRAIEWEQKEQSVIIRTSAASGSVIAKEIEINLHPTAARAALSYRVTNRGDWALTFAPWALSVMAAGGTAVLPLPSRGPHPLNLLPTASLVFWPYTDFSDPRWQPGYEYFRIQHQENPKQPFKIGLSADQVWMAYANHGHLFYKESPVIAGAIYPDRGTQSQVYSDGNFTELETMGPLQLVQPGESVTHNETWVLLDNIRVPENDNEINTLILPVLKKLLD